MGIIQGFCYGVYCEGGARGGEGQEGFWGGAVHLGGGEFWWSGDVASVEPVERSTHGNYFFSVFVNK